jgi:predicted small metal-binding protein
MRLAWALETAWGPRRGRRGEGVPPEAAREEVRTMSEWSMVCPPCGKEIRAASEEELVMAVQAHARDEHGHEVDEAEIRAAMVKTEEA